MKKRTKLIHVRNVEDFDKVRNIDKEKYNKVIIVLVKDVDFEGVEFTPIDASGLDVTMKGKLSIDRIRSTINNVVIDNGDEPETGFFSKTNNFEMIDVNYANYYVKGGVCTGGLVGSANGDVAIYNCGIAGIVDAEAYCGSLFGTAEELKVSNSIVMTTVRGKDIIGGVAGVVDSVKLYNNIINTLVEAKVGKAQGEIVGYNSEEMEPTVRHMLKETMPLLKDEYTPEDMELIKSMIK